MQAAPTCVHIYTVVVPGVSVLSVVPADSFGLRLREVSELVVGEELRDRLLLVEELLGESDELGERLW